VAATFGRSNSATLDETIERWVGNLEMIKTALLTIGDSPIANAAIRAVSEHSHLEYIVFSRKKRKVSLLSRIREYGFLYSLHALVCRIFFAVSNDFDEREFASAESVIWDESASSGDIAKTIASVDVVVCCLFNRVLDGAFIESFEHCVNFHPSLLPDYRGPEPIYWGLLNNEAEFGLTLHYMTERIDDGDVISQSRCQRPSLPLSILVEKKLAPTLSELLQTLLTQVEAGSVSAEKQGQGFYLPFATLVNIKKHGSGFPKKSA